MPSANDLFSIDVIGSTSLSMFDFRIGIGTLFGPEALETDEMLDIYFLTSSEVQGLRVMLKIFRFSR